MWNFESNILKVLEVEMWNHMGKKHWIANCGFSNCKLWALDFMQKKMLKFKKKNEKPKSIKHFQTVKTCLMNEFERKNKAAWENVPSTKTTKPRRLNAIFFPVLNHKIVVLNLISTTATATFGSRGKKVTERISSHENYWRKPKWNNL